MPSPRLLSPIVALAFVFLAACGDGATPAPDATVAPTATAEIAATATAIRYSRGRTNAAAGHSSARGRGDGYSYSRCRTNAAAGHSSARGQGCLLSHPHANERGKSSANRNGRPHPLTQAYSHGGTHFRRHARCDRNPGANPRAAAHQYRNGPTHRRSGADRRARVPLCSRAP